MSIHIGSLFAATPDVWYKLDEGKLNLSTNTVYSTGGLTSSLGTNGNVGGTLGWITNGLPPVPPPGSSAALSLSGANFIRTDYSGIAGNSARTVAAWIRPATVQTNTNATIVSWGPNTTGRRFDLRLAGTGSPNQIRLEITGGAVVGTNNVADGNWHHVAVTFPNAGTLGSLKFYVDGALDATTYASGSSSTALNTTATNVLIGNDLSGSGRFFSGQIDDVRIYNTNLSQGDIQALALAPGVTNSLGSQTVLYGTSVSINAGIGELVATNVLNYQWSLNGAAILNATNSTFTTNNVQAAIGTPFNISVTVTNAYGSATNSGVLTVQAWPAQITLLGTNVVNWVQGSTFVDAGAVATNVYGNPAAVVTNGVVDVNTPGTYLITYTADDGLGNTLSTNRTVNVQAAVVPPVLAAGLTNENVECGGRASFAVSVSGATPIGYAWFLNGSVISDATNNSLSLTGLSVGNYDVTILATNAYGSLTNSATLVVQDTTPPVLTLLGANPIILQTGTAFQDPGATATDSCAGALPVTSNLNVDTNTPGVYTITYTANDGNGNISTTNRTVYVKNSAAGTKPNIIFILADDLGYGDVGIFYQNSRPSTKPKLLTPQLDSMASQGAILRQHYSSSPVCAPARASLLLGQHQGNATIRDNEFDKALPNNHTLATVLKNAGYYCGAIGKWGLAGQGNLPAVFDPATVPGHPLHRGFDEFFGFIDHNSGHVYYHDSSHPLYQDYTNVTATYTNIYSTDLFFARAKKFVTDRETSAPNQPFFLYLAPTAVHAALQVPGAPFPSGSGTNGGLQWPLAATPDTADTWIHPDYTNAVTSYANAVITGTNWSATMKRYATMGRRLDDGVGDLLQLLRDLNIATNTLVIFSSDNGPANESDGGSYTSDPRYFDSWGNFDGIKRDLWEAGVREPTIAWWPGVITSNSVSDTVSAFWDWLPTFAELSGQAQPAQADGVSLLPSLTGIGNQRSRGYLYFEYYYNGTFAVDGGTDGLFARKDVSARNQLQSIRVGDFVAVRYSITNGTDPFRLYNVVADPHEDNDLSGNATNAALLATVQNLVKEVRHPDSGAARPYDSDLVPATATTAVTNGVLNYAAFQGNWSWVPDLDALTAVSTGRVSGLDFSVAPSADNFGLSFKGYITIPADGQYTFYLQEDSGAQLWLHDVHVIDDDFNHDGSEVSGTVLLKAGLHPLRLFYRHGTGTNNLTLKYSGPNLSKQTVPVSAFSVDCADCSASSVALDDYATIPQNTATNISVLSNDLLYGTNISIVSVGPPQIGTAVITNGGILYTPATNFLGSDQFTYTITDGSAVSSANVHVSVAFSDGSLWFPFNEGSGLSTTDAGGDYTGILSGFANDPAEWVTGKQNRAILFDGVADQITVTGYKGVLGASNRTVAAWINTTNTGAIVGWGPKVNGEKWIFRVQADNGVAGAIRVEVEGGYIVGSTVVTNGQWHHVAAVFTNNVANVTNIALYVDGQLETISAKQAQAVNTLAGSDVQIGNDIQGRYFNGIIDELHIYNRALSASEINALYAATNQAAAAWYYRYFGNAPVDWYASDGTGSRLLEYALGTQPGTTTASQLSLQAKIVDGYLQVSFPQRIAGSSDLVYAVLASPDLVDWSTLTTSLVQTTPLSSPTGFEQAVYQADAGVNDQSPLFLKLKVTLP